MSSICPWPCLASVETVVPAAAKSSDSGKSFAQALSCSGDLQLTKLPPKIVMGTSVHVKISQAEYEFGVAACKRSLHGRVTLHKGDPPLTTLSLNRSFPVCGLICTIGILHLLVRVFSSLISVQLKICKEFGH